jgi:flagella basal body P-ring formation protein FlgA
MKTDLFGRIILTFAFVVMLVAVARAAFAAVAVTPEQAIERAVAQRLEGTPSRRSGGPGGTPSSRSGRPGGDLSITVTALQTSVAAEPGLAALPEPGGRAGQPTRFVLSANGARRGIAIATITVAGSYARAARAIARNEVIAADAIDVVRGELPHVGFKRLPSSGEAIGLIARRDIAEGETLTDVVLQFPPLVRSGDVVLVTVKVGTVEITSKGTVSGSGHEGDIVRVTPLSTGTPGRRSLGPGGRPVKARITGRGAVEIVQ